MTKALLCAALVVATAATGAGATTCSPRTDPRGDTLLERAVRVDAPHVDLLGYDVVVGPSEVVAVIRTAGGEGAGRWSIDAFVGTQDYYFSAIRGGGGSRLLDDPRNPGRDTEFVAARPGSGELIEARGTISDSGEVRIRVRLKDYGKKAPRRGTRFTAFEVWSYQRLPAAAEIRDEARSTC